MHPYPLIFRFSQLVKCDAYTARVHGDGRVLADLVDDEWYCSGVQPGGQVGCGDTVQGAYAEFRHELMLVLEQLGEDHKSFAEFEKGVNLLFSGRNGVKEVAWLAAVEAFRCGDATRGEELSGIDQIRVDELKGVTIDLISASFPAGCRNNKSEIAPSYAPASDAFGLAAADKAA